jgi:crossover junction endodeoxyribonuclease RuvC
MTQIILGLDPGTATTGFGVVTSDGQHTTHVAHGCITTPAHTESHHRLRSIADQLKVILQQYRPDRVAVEDIYFYKNVSTAMGVAQARGVLLYITAQAELPISHFTPLQVKQAVTGQGRADKRQVQKMVTMILGLSAVPQPDDAADALAIAITAAHTTKLKSIS